MCKEKCPVDLAQMTEIFTYLKKEEYSEKEREESCLNESDSLNGD